MQSARPTAGVSGCRRQSSQWPGRRLRPPEDVTLGRHRLRLQLGLDQAGLALIKGLVSINRRESSHCPGGCNRRGCSLSIAPTSCPGRTAQRPRRTCGPQPNTAAVWPSLMPAMSAPKWAVGKMSERRIAWASLTSPGSLECGVGERGAGMLGLQTVEAAGGHRWGLWWSVWTRRPDGCRQCYAIQPPSWDRLSRCSCRRHPRSPFGSRLDCGR